MSKAESSIQKSDNVINKKPFNKKKWREQKYSNKTKIQRWELIKRKRAEREYQKECKKLNVDFKSKHRKADTSMSHGGIKEAQSEYKAILQKKKEEKQEQERIRKERIEAIKAYKERKAEKFRKLSQKTRKGQPLMRGRIELLLEKIQKHYVNNDEQKT